MKWKWFLLAVVLISCDDYSECGVTDYSEDIYINFYNSADSIAKNVLFESMDVIYANGEKISYEDTVAATSFIFPLDMSATTTNLVFKDVDFDYDLAISYRTQARIENPDCGPIFRVTAITGESIAFDSVAVVVTELSKNLAPHVEIYF